MALTFDQFMQGIAWQETRGRGDQYSVVNDYGAVGKYQVLKSNIPEWSRRVLGYSITWQKYRDSPSLQEKIVRGILKGYWDNWGARGAAAAWYAGPGNHGLHQSTRSQPGGPSIKDYVDSVISHAGASSGKNSTSPTATSSKIKPEAPPTRGESAESFGFVEALFDSDPSLKKLLDKAVKEGWAASAQGVARFKAALRDTDWWKKHSQKERDYLTKYYGDPATAKADYKTAYIHVRQLAAAMGIVETEAQKKNMKTWAYNVTAKGWNDEQLRNEIGKHVYFAGDNWQGQGGEEQKKLREYAYSMGVTMSSQWYADKSRNIIRGVAAEQDYLSEIRKHAKAAFPQWSKQIDAGQSVSDMASPYMQSMAQILELPPGSINLFNPVIKKALAYKDPKTGQGTIKPLWQFENDLRKDPRWLKTKNAQDGMMQVAHQVLSDFGFKT